MEAMEENFGYRTVSFVLSEAECDVLESVAYLEPYIQDTLETAQEVQGQYRVDIWEDDLKDTLDALAYHTQTLENPRDCQRCCRLIERLVGYYLLVKD